MVKRAKETVYEMEKEKLFEIATMFREAIVQAKKENRFDWRDRMNNFPNGCCDDICDLLGYYLLKHYGIKSHQRVGRYEKEHCNHVWLMLEDNTVIDITGNQFPDWESVYVGDEAGYYLELEDFQNQDNFDIQQQTRLWKAYQIILEYLEFH